MKITIYSWQTNTDRVQFQGNKYIKYYEQDENNIQLLYCYHTT